MDQLIYNKVIRYANNEDLEWAKHLINRVLSSFYKSDHFARAQYIFDQFINGGKDVFGGSSAGQYIAVAEDYLKPAGLIHFVERKKSTINISLLIVHERFRGNGVGRSLLSYVEQYAREHGFRNLHCTIADTNVIALKFLSSNGFSVIGTTKKRHRRRVVETSLLCKQVEDNACAV